MPAGECDRCSALTRPPADLVGEVAAYRTCMTLLLARRRGRIVARAHEVMPFTFSGAFWPTRLPFVPRLAAGVAADVSIVSPCSVEERTMVRVIGPS